MSQSKKEKREAAKERQEKYDKLTLEEKLSLAMTYGNEYTKQVVKLRKKIQEEERSARKKKSVQKKKEGKK